MYNFAQAQRRNGVERIWWLQNQRWSVSAVGSKKLPDGTQSQILVTCCVLHKMCTSMKYQIPERLATDVGETDGQEGNTEEELE